MNRVKVAFIGAGGMANAVHYPSVTSCANAEIVAACDLDRARLEQTAAKFGVARTFTDYHAMLEKTAPDAVYVLMPPHLLFDVAMDVMERGHNLFIEKPPAVTTFQAESLARMAERKGLITAVGFQRRYHPMLLKLRDEVCRRGALHQVVVEFVKNSPPQEICPYYRGSIDILHCDAIHAVDALRYYCGLAEVTSVKSDVRTLDCWYDAAFNALVRFANGVLGVLVTTWRTGGRFLRCEFHGYGAMALADADAGGSLWADNGSEPVLTTDTKAAAGEDSLHATQGFLAESRAFLDAVQARSPVHNNLSDAAKTMRLADMILAAGH